MPNEADILPDARPNQRGWWWRCCYLLAWFAAISLGAVALLKIIYHDGNYVLTCLNAFTRYLYLPIYACLGWAVWQRRGRLAIVCLAIAICHCIWVTPEFVRDRRFDAAAAKNRPTKATTIRIFFANVKAHNENMIGFFEEIPNVDPDVIVLVEFLPHWNRLLAKIPAFKPYKFGNAASLPAGGEFAVLSKLPIENPQRLYRGGRLRYAFDVNVEGAPLRVFGLHSPRPMNLPGMDYDGFWNETIAILLSQPDPTVVVGDFNATPYSRVYKTLTADKFRSAHDDRGRGYATTWPNGAIPIPPIRIDQALLTAGVECVAISEGIGTGSDHKPLILDVQIRDSVRHPIASAAVTNGERQ
jgi:endonuclease/exonuclease/phosphatase (EEP) superfamily protein YafD